MDNQEKGKVPLPPKLVDSWNEMMAAAGLIRLGKGRIVAVKINGETVRYVEPKDSRRSGIWLLKSTGD